jgi:hypothetical protein
VLHYKNERYVDSLGPGSLFCHIVDCIIYDVTQTMASLGDMEINQKSKGVQQCAVCWNKDGERKKGKAGI